MAVHGVVREVELTADVALGQGPGQHSEHDHLAFAQSVLCWSGARAERQGLRRLCAERVPECFLDRAVLPVPGQCAAVEGGCEPRVAMLELDAKELSEELM